MIIFQFDSIVIGYGDYIWLQMLFHRDGALVRRSFGTMDGCAGDFTGSLAAGRCRVASAFS
jgi:hypothetical protein